jgi:hypothetical protein
MDSYSVFGLELDDAHITMRNKTVLDNLRKINVAVHRGDVVQNVGQGGRYRRLRLEGGGCTGVSDEIEDCTKEVL